MNRVSFRSVWWRVGPAIGLALVLAGCSFQRGPNRVVPLPPNVDPEQVIDADDPVESVTPLRPDDLAEVGRIIQAERLRELQKEVEEQKKRGVTPPAQRKYNILACSGGAVYGAYSAGVLCGWTESGLPPDQGGRPEFDVVTGISTGALIAPFAFLGSEYDPVIRREYTTTRTEDIFSRQRSIRRIFSQSLVDNTPFRERIERALSPVVLSRIAAEHEKGRRLFIGTTNIDTKRIVLWDVGAIAKRGTPEATKLIHSVVLASASIPGLFPPVKITVTIDGRQYEELHMDGSVTRSLFFRPPYLSPTERASFGPNSLAGSNLYVLVAGKINPAPNAVRVRTFPLALEATSTLLYSLTRGDLYRMYTYCLLTGMNLRVSAIPEDTPAPTKSAEFDPVEMTKLFEAGRGFGRRGDVARPTKEGAGEDTAWRDVPPGLKGGEKQGLRTGLNLTVRPKEAGEGTTTRGPEADKGAIVPPVPPIR